MAQCHYSANSTCATHRYVSCESRAQKDENMIGLYFPWSANAAMQIENVEWKRISKKKKHMLSGNRTAHRQVLGRKWANIMKARTKDTMQFVGTTAQTSAESFLTKRAPPPMAGWSPAIPKSLFEQILRTAREARGIHTTTPRVTQRNKPIVTSCSARPRATVMPKMFA